MIQEISRASYVHCTSVSVGNSGNNDDNDPIAKIKLSNSKRRVLINNSLFFFSIFGPTQYFNLHTVLIS